MFIATNVFTNYAISLCINILRTLARSRENAIDGARSKDKHCFLFFQDMNYFSHILILLRDNC